MIAMSSGVFPMLRTKIQRTKKESANLRAESEPETSRFAGSARSYADNLPSQNYSAMSEHNDPDVPEFQKLLNGFPRTAHFLAADDGKSTVLVRRFDVLAVRNLLHLEGRVAALEKAQHEMDREDFDYRRRNKAATRAAQSWEQFALLTELANITDLKEREEREEHNRRYGILLEEEAKPPDHSVATSVPLAIMSEWIRIRRVEVDHERQPERDRLTLVGAQAHIQDDEEPFGYTKEELRAVRARWEVAQAIHVALKEYYVAVKQYREMLKLEEPAARTDVTVQRWTQGDLKVHGKAGQRQFLKGSAMDDVFKEERDPPRSMRKADLRQMSSKDEERAYEHKISVDKLRALGSEEVRKDRVTLGVSASVDPLTRGVAKWSWLMERGRDKNFRYREISLTPESFISKWVTGFVLAYAALLLVGALWCLYYVRIEQGHIEAVLAVLSAFIIFFGLTLLFLTNSTRTEVFGGTAAYAAVLVVFLSLQSDGNTSNNMDGTTTFTNARFTDTTFVNTTSAAAAFLRAAKLM